MIGTPIDRLDAFEREVSRLRVAVGVLVALIVLVAVLGLAAGGLVPTAVAQGPSLRVHELVIVDDRGVERARLGGRLPDAVVNGQHLKRGGNAAGLLIYDDTGRERGGYITFDEPSGNALLTLDTRGGQVAYLAADKREGIALRLWTAGNMVELRADSSGARTTTARAGRIVSQIPPPTDAEIEAMCSGLKADLAGLNPKPPMEEILKACAERMPESVCRACLGLR